MENEEVFEQCKACKFYFNVFTLLGNVNNEYVCKRCKLKDDKRKIFFDKSEEKFLPYPEKYVKDKEYFENLSAMSKHPLRCPICSKCIFVFNVDTHFKYEHKHIPIVSAPFGVRCSSKIFPRNLNYGITQCILLNVMEGDFLSSSKMNLIDCPGTNQNLVLLLMASRFNKNMKSIKEKIPLDLKFKEGDIIIIWLASNIPTNLKCSIVASTMDYENRLKYSGPMLTLRESSERVAKEGFGLPLMDIQCNGMTKNGENPLALDVLIHSQK